MTAIYRPSSLIPKDEVSNSSNTMLKSFFFSFLVFVFVFKGEPVFTGYKNQTGHH